MKRLLLGSFAVVSLFAVSANAAPITGNINLVGDFQPTVNGSGTQNMALANGIDFLPLGGGMGTFQTLSGNGGLAAYANLSGGSIKDFTFSPFAPVSSFYSVSTGSNTFSFDLTSLTVNNQNASFLNLSGAGIIHATGFDNTEGTFFLSGQSSNGASQTAKFSWSAGSAAQTGDEHTGVPEPASLSLVGLGLLAAAMMRRRKVLESAVPRVE